MRRSTSYWATDQHMETPKQKLLCFAFAVGRTTHPPSCLKVWHKKLFKGVTVCFCMFGSVHLRTLSVLLYFSPDKMYSKRCIGNRITEGVSPRTHYVSDMTSLVLLFVMEKEQNRSLLSNPIPVACSTLCRPSETPMALSSNPMPPLSDKCQPASENIVVMSCHSLPPQSASTSQFTYIRFTNNQPTPPSCQHPLPSQTCKKEKE
ncbi:uncharacterized protein LOC130930419 isoform X1 [Corythoichthys intestinalis]|uniref:uncharacterized protein LOC130930419 isoform X1 n=1 Tax=Corythoichthys intestinalis TaxID=161448 RepID=UPI0025A5A6D5|nr:uncharacterized protein LOC130930419 isoform X1 [Corythoichthys intestinalis]